MTAALYFPMIDVPDTPWFFSTLLYWDSVASIIPDDFLENPETLSDQTRNLLKEGLLLPAQPSAASWSFVDGFQAYISSLPIEELQSRRRSLTDGEVSRIHNDKLLEVSLIETLLVAGLADASSLHPWLLVEKKTAQEWMAALAIALCHPGSDWATRSAGVTDSWVPVTDRPTSMEALLAGFGAASGVTDTEHRTTREVAAGVSRTAELRSVVLDALLPTPTRTSPSIDWSPFGTSTVISYPRSAVNLSPVWRLCFSSPRARERGRSIGSSKRPRRRLRKPPRT
ncbi:hypothetical protein ACLQ2Q_21350 [Microbacterium sp. DT81.1]|uniref:hypothetical protein n=1 Tax=Microbacterium sp. DT81.1 TaxID=3393413 RepID=UPI003CF7D954